MRIYKAQDAADSRRELIKRLAVLRKNQEFSTERTDHEVSLPDTRQLDLDKVYNTPELKEKRRLLKVLDLVDLTYIQSDDRTTEQKERDNTIGEWKVGEDRRNTLKQLTESLWGPVAIPVGVTVMNATPLGPAFDASFFALGTNGLYNLCKEGTLGLNSETVFNTLSLLPGGFRGGRWLYRKASPAYDLYRTVSESPIDTKLYNSDYIDNLLTFEGPSLFTPISPYKRFVNLKYLIERVPAEAPKTYGYAFYGKHGDTPVVFDSLGRPYGTLTYYDTGEVASPLNKNIIIGSRTEYPMQNLLVHGDKGSMSIKDGNLLPRPAEIEGNTPYIWWQRNSPWGTLFHTYYYGPEDTRFLRATNTGYEAPGVVLSEEYPISNLQFVEKNPYTGFYDKCIIVTPTGTKLSTRLSFDMPF